MSNKLNSTAIYKDINEKIVAQVWHSSLPLIFLSIAFARPELRGYKVSSKSEK